MKRLFSYLLLATICFVVSCDTAFDDSKIWDKLNDHEARIKRLEELCKQMNTNIGSLQVIVEALQSNDYITNVAPIIKDGETIGYTITFAKADPITIYNGTDGADGTDGGGATPVIGVRQDVDGIYYWTLNGEWLTDEQGSKVKAQGSDGMDGEDGADGKDGADGEDGKDGVDGQSGITPRLKIVDEYWYVSYDDGQTWTQLDKATGDDGDTLFIEVREDDECVYFVLADGTELVLPKYNGAEIPELQNNKIYYTTTNGKKLFPTYQAGIDAIMLSNSYEDGVGVMTFDDDITLIGNAFHDCTTLESVTIPASVTEIGVQAFYNCTSLSSVYCKATTPPVAVYVENSIWKPFDGNALYRSIYVAKESVESYREDSYWSRYASSIKAEGDTTESTVTQIYYTTTNNKPLDLTYTLFDAVFAGNVYDADLDMCVLSFEGELTDFPQAFNYEDTLESIIIPEGVTTIAPLAFGGCSSLWRVELPQTIESIGSNAFSSCNALSEVHIPDLVTWCNIDFKSSIFNPSNETQTLYFDGVELTEVVIPSEVTTIRPYAFYGVAQLTDVTIHDSVTSIGDKAFTYCTNISNLTIGSGVESIGTSAFAYCSSLTEVTLPEKLQHINSNLFERCDMLSSVTLGGNTVSIGDKALYNCASLTEITIPASVTTIGNSAFSGTSLKGVYISDLAAWCQIDFVADSNPLSISNLLYLDGELLIDAKIPDGVTEIKSSALRDCASLTSVTLPDSVTAIGEDAFMSCGELTTLDLGNGVVSIGASAFSYCDSLTEITIPASVNSIGDNAFGYTNYTLERVNIVDLAAWCSIDFAYSTSNPVTFTNTLYLNGNEVTEVTIPSNVTEIKPYVFYNMYSLIKIDMHEGVTSIGASAFAHCRNITEITIPASIRAIGDSAFSDCSSLSRVNISDLSAWCRIDFDGAATPTQHTGGLYLNGVEITELTIPEDITEIKPYSFYGCTSLTSVKLHEGITRVGASAFDGCDGLTEITVPASVTFLDYYAFNSKNLATATILSTTPCELGYKSVGGGIYEPRTYYGQFGNAMIYVPSESLYDYKSASGWSTMADSIYPIE